MKKLSLLLILPFSLLLSACQAEKAPEPIETPETTTEAKPVSKVINITDSTTVASTNTDVKTETAATTPVDTSEGKSLHTENCTRCHGSEIYTRTKRKMTSLAALGAQVRMCDSQLETQLFPEDLEKITSYLNQSYYKF